ncbi:MAG TPA: hypothetical protein VH475_16980 [Tepidisphaeraceae bacterium]|jgi:phytol kinase
MKDILFIILVLAASRLALYAVLRIHLRFQVGPEICRKLLHIAIGLILCPLPWVLESRRSAISLCGIYLALLVARRYLAALGNHVNGILDGVGRKSLGEFLFPITAALLFILSGDDRITYLAPMLTLALADAAAALVGRRYGMARFQTVGGCKSLEGSLAFAVVTFSATHLTLLFMGNTGRAESVLLAALVALILALVEAWATGGWDNLVVPMTALLLLKTLQHAPATLLAPLTLGAVIAVMTPVLVYSLVPTLPRGKSSPVGEAISPNVREF